MKDLAVKGSRLIAFVCFAAAICFVSLSVLTLDILNRHESSGYVDSRSSDFPIVQDVTKSNGYYNISLEFSNVANPIRLDNVLINPNSQEDFNPTIYVNGTIVKTYPLSSLKSGDSVQVNLTLPCSECASKSSLYLCVMGDSFGCGKEVTLP